MSQQKEASLPRAVDFKFLRTVDPKSPSRAAIHLLAGYAADAANFFHNRNGSRSVESLVSARKFAEYIVTYVSIRNNVGPNSLGASNDKIPFSVRLDSVRSTIADFPVRELKRIWHDASDAVHPPEGISEKDIENYQNAYRVQAAGVLKDALKIGHWFRDRYGMQSWFARLLFSLRNMAK